MTDPQTVEDLLARLERERLDADRLYNAALTTLNRALQAPPSLPDAPQHPYDASRLPAVNSAWNILPNGAPRFDASFKGRLGRLIWRLVGPALEQQQQFNSAVADHLNRNVGAHEEAHRALVALVETTRREFEALVRFESLLVQYLMTITAYVDTKDRAAGGPEIRQRLALTEQRMLAMKRDLESARSQPVATAASPAVAAATPGRRAPRRRRAASSRALWIRCSPTCPSKISSAASAPRFVGVSRTTCRFAGAENVLDIGCGRGELLHALQERGISARGVDVSPAMVDICRGRGFDVELGDALAFVAKQPDASAGGLVAVQVVEHFTPDYLTRFLEAAFHALRPGSALVLETINPSCWMAFFETYMRDLTHKQPLHPDTLRHLVASSGFSSVDVQFRAPVSDDDRLASLDAADGETPAVVRPVVEALNDHAMKLNRRLFSSMDYVVIARR
ncbi:MAG: class I SAM-dependent methyltransferase [Vicinamibacterales bacterium]